MVHCVKCHTWYDTSDSRQRYCSVACRQSRRVRTCQGCHVTFPNTIVIDGVSHNISRRRYCLQCKPWRGQVLLTEEVRALKNKIKCQAYYSKNQKKLCKKQSEHQKKIALRRKKELITLTKGCQACGYDKSQRNLSFHHLRDKKFQITQHEFRYAKAKIADELKKCICVCHLCHGEIHDGLRDSSDIESWNVEFINIVNIWLKGDF